MTALRVAVGVLRRADGRVLVAERDPHRHQGGGFEFPGGKCEADESGQQALQRELVEEIGIAAVAAQPLIRVRHGYADRAVELETFLVDDWQGEPTGLEGQPLQWQIPAELDARSLPAANRPILAALRWPATYLITPDTDAVAAPGDVLDRVADYLSAGEGGWVQLRRSDAGAARWWRLVHDLAACCRQANARLLVNTVPERAAQLPPGAGLHLNAATVARVQQRPVPADTPLSCAAHNRGELQSAHAATADLALLGPVQPTPSHPDRPALGWTTFNHLAGATPLPLYALGGVGPEDLPTARNAGAVGVAGIRAFRRRA